MDAATDQVLDEIESAVGFFSHVHKPATYHGTTLPILLAEGQVTTNARIEGEQESTILEIETTPGCCGSICES